MKGKFLQEYHLLLVGNRLEEFEKKLSSHFLLSFGKLLPLRFSYTDWLVIQLRPIRKNNISQYFLNMDYLEPKSLYLSSNPKKFVMLLQFLTYAQQLDFKIDLNFFLQIFNALITLLIASINNINLSRMRINQFLMRFRKK